MAKIQVAFRSCWQRVSCCSRKKVKNIGTYRKENPPSPSEKPRCSIQNGSEEDLLEYLPDKKLIEERNYEDASGGSLPLLEDASDNITLSETEVYFETDLFNHDGAELGDYCEIDHGDDYEEYVEEIILSGDEDDDESLWEEITVDSMELHDSWLERINIEEEPLEEEDDDETTMSVAELIDDCNAQERFWIKAHASNLLRQHSSHSL